MMAGRAAYIFQIVVLSARPHAFLAGGRPLVGELFRAYEDVLELHHSRIRKKKGGIVMGDEGGRLNDGVAVLAKEVQKATSRFGASKLHVSILEAIQSPDDHLKGKSLSLQVTSHPLPCPERSSAKS